MRRERLYPLDLVQQSQRVESKVDELMCKIDFKVVNDLYDNNAVHIAVFDCNKAQSLHTALFFCFCTQNLFLVVLLFIIALLLFLWLGIMYA